MKFFVGTSLVFCLLGACIDSYADPQVESQKTSEQLLTLGKEYSKKGEYGRAAEYFKQAAKQGNAVAQAL